MLITTSYFREDAVTDNPDIVAKWEVPLSDKVHVVQFEHGTTSGKRVIYVDGKVRIMLSNELIRFLENAGALLMIDLFLCLFKVPYNF